jgi:hypothetical protein
LARNVRTQFEHIAEMIPAFPENWSPRYYPWKDSSANSLYRSQLPKGWILADAQEILEIDSVFSKTS